MAHPIRFDEKTAWRWLAALKLGGPIAAASAGWSGLDMLMLAGVCHFAVMSQGPVRPGDWPGDWKALPPEHLEARSDTFFRDLRDAIEFHSQLARLVEEREFDEAFEPRVEALIYDRDGCFCVQPHRGFKPV
jgi:hypothetical protein